MENKNINEGKVELPSSYFAKGKLEYNNWKLAWFREAIQNSSDAGASRIDFTIENNPENDKLIKVVCKDNGKGMDSDTLLNVFLCLGGSKKDEGATGGFGYAKVLLAFAHDHYTISTRNILCEGSGGNYTWKEVEENTEGVSLEVHMDRSDTSVWELENALDTIVRNSNMPHLSITLNGREIGASKEKLPYSKNTSLGMLSFRDNPGNYSRSSLWVRMNGLAMFTFSLYSQANTSFEGYLELEGRSIDVLTSNRDSLSNEKSRELNEIFNILANDREKLKLAGDIDLTLNKYDVNFSDMDTDSQNELISAAKLKNMSPDDLLQFLKGVSEDLDAASPFMSLAKKVDHLQKKMNSHIENIPADLYPDNFKVKHAADSAEEIPSDKIAASIARDMKLIRNAKLASGWSAIVNTLLECESYRDSLGVTKKGEHFFYYDQMIQTGFVFGSPAGLNERKPDEKRVSIMINPEYVLTEDLEVGDIIDIAHHELTHLPFEYHCEEFSIKEMGLRRIARRDIGDRVLVNSFKDSISLWRENNRKKTTNTAEKASRYSNDDMEP